MDARVVDRAGRPILGLTPRDFRLKVDGRVVPLESVTWVDGGHARPIRRSPRPPLAGRRAGAAARAPHRLLLPEGPRALAHHRASCRCCAARARCWTAWARTTAWPSSPSIPTSALDGLHLRPRAAAPRARPLDPVRAASRPERRARAVPGRAPPARGRPPRGQPRDRAAPHRRGARSSCRARRASSCSAGAWAAGPRASACSSTATTAPRAARWSQAASPSSPSTSRTPTTTRWRSAWSRSRRTRAASTPRPTCSRARPSTRLERALAGHYVLTFARPPICRASTTSTSGWCGEGRRCSRKAVVRGLTRPPRLRTAVAARGPWLPRRRRSPGSSPSRPARRSPAGPRSGRGGAGPARRSCAPAPGGCSCARGGRGRACGRSRPGRARCSRRRRRWRHGPGGPGSAP